MSVMFNLVNTTLLAAADTIDLNPTGNFSQLGTLEVPQIVQRLIAIILVIASIIFFFMLVIGGIKWILSGGDKAQTESARNQITAALVGLVIVFAAWAISKLVGSFFKVDILNLENVFGS